MTRDAVLKKEIEKYKFTVEDAKRYFGLWDMQDPVTWAILRVVQAQNDLANAVYVAVEYANNTRMVEEAIEERIKAIIGLQTALEEEPRGFQ